MTLGTFINEGRRIKCLVLVYNLDFVLSYEAYVDLIVSKRYLLKTVTETMSVSNVKVQGSQTSKGKPLRNCFVNY